MMHVHVPFLWWLAITLVRVQLQQLSANAQTASWVIQSIQKARTSSLTSILIHIRRLSFCRIESTVHECTINL